MTPTERRLFKESVIREYKLKHPEFQKVYLYRKVYKIMRGMIPINIVLGLIASIILIFWKGWETFIVLLLYGIIWMTLISTALSLVARPK